MNKKEPIAIARKFEQLTNVFYLMVGIPLLAFIWVYLNQKVIQPQEYFADPTYGTFLQAALLLTALALGSLAFVQYRRRFSGLEPSTEADTTEKELLRKTEMYAEAARQKFFLLTLSTLLVVAGFYLTAQGYYALFYSILLIIFSVHRPSPERMAKDMRLKKEERTALRDIVRQNRR